MIDGNSVLAIIPARGGSKGLPAKNILNLLGKPLIGWAIDAAKNSIYVDRTIVSTDDPKIAEIAVKQGAEVPFIRPPGLATDTATTISVVEHALNYFSNNDEEYDYILLLEPTSPLTEASDVNLAFEELAKNQEIADSVVGVTKVISAHPVFDVTIGKNGLIQPYLGADFSSAGRRQDLAELYYFEGSLYISSVQTLLKERSFYHSRTLAYVVPRWKAFEIDDMVDFICVEAIMNNLDYIKQHK